MPNDGTARVGFFELVRQIVRAHPEGITPQQVRDIIKAQHPAHYGTDSHQRNVERGNYADLDHALLAQIYIAGAKASGIMPDRSQKPMKLFPVTETVDDAVLPEDTLDTENLDKLEAGVGTMYVLGTNLYTKEGAEIIKIGITTGSVEARINQLYTTGVPFRFRIIKTEEPKNYNRLETALHSLLDPYRINRSREFFTDHCLEHLDKIIALHAGHPTEPIISHDRGERPYRVGVTEYPSRYRVDAAPVYPGVPESGDSGIDPAS